MNKEQAWLDANIILRFLLKDQQELFEATFKLFAAADKGTLLLHLHPLTLAEVVWTLQGFYEYEKKEIATVLSGLIEADGLRLDDKEVALKALADFAEKNVDYIDAYLAANAAINGPATVYTLDRKHFSRLSGDIRILPE
jgi:predicted nucleic-acid-binding protein